MKNSKIENAKKRIKLIPTCFDIENTDRYVAPLENDCWTCNAGDIEIPPLGECNVEP